MHRFPPSSSARYLNTVAQWTLIERRDRISLDDRKTTVHTFQRQIRALDREIRWWDYREKALSLRLLQPKRHLRTRASLRSITIEWNSWQIDCALFLTRYLHVFKRFDVDDQSSTAKLEHMKSESRDMTMSVSYSWIISKRDSSLCPDNISVILVNENVK